MNGSVQRLPHGVAKRLAQDPACEYMEQQMLRAEQEQGEGAVWALLFVSSPARRCTSSAAANGPLNVSYLSDKSFVTSCGRERCSLTMRV